MNAGEHQQGVKLRIAGGDVLEQRVELLRRRRSQLAGDGDDAVRVPSTGLSQTQPHRTTWAKAARSTTCRTATVRGTRADAERESPRRVRPCRRYAPSGCSRVGELLEAWFAIASTGWAPTTIRQTRSVLDRYLRPHPGHIPVGDVTAAMIDATYAVLSRRGGVGGRALAPGTLARVRLPACPPTEARCSDSQGVAHK